MIDPRVASKLYEEEYPCIHQLNIDKVEDGYCYDQLTESEIGEFEKYIIPGYETRIPIELPDKDKMGVNGLILKECHEDLVYVDPSNGRIVTIPEHHQIYKFELHKVMFYQVLFYSECVFNKINDKFVDFDESKRSYGEITIRIFKKSKLMDFINRHIDFVRGYNSSRNIVIRDVYEKFIEGIDFIEINDNRL